MSIPFAGIEVYKLVQDYYTKVRESIPDELNWGPTSPRDEALCHAQTELREKGYREAHLVHSIYGWSVRCGSGLDNFELLAGVRWGDVDGTAKDALQWGVRWCLQDPEKRFLTYRGTGLPMDLELAARELQLNVFPA